MNNDNWRFDEKISKQFDSYVRKHVPLYDEMHSQIGNISRWFAQDGTSVYDIGTSTGEVIRNIKENNKGRNVSYVGIDISQSMIDIASKRFIGDESVSIEYQDAIDLSIENASLVTSVLTIQFMKINERQKLIDKIYNGLNDGGAFIFVEKVYGENSLFENVWNELYHDFKIKNNISEKEVIEKATSIRGVLKPLTMTKNEELLINAGFRDIDIFFKWNNFVGFVAVK